jgi:hypothetical protein
LVFNEDSKSKNYIQRSGVSAKIEQFLPNMLLLQVIADFACIPQADRKWWPTDSEK